MPLKHATETFLLFLLGVVIVCTGFLITTLPGLPEGLLPWGVLFALSVLYPLSLVHIFRSNRADYPFRWLHWFPASMLLVWAVLEFLDTSSSLPMASVSHWVFWGWGLPLVTLGFLLAVVFCLRVIRRWKLRIVLLLIAFIPFTVLAAFSQSGYHWDREVADILWAANWWSALDQRISGTGGKLPEVAYVSSDGKNLEESDDPGEEAWRARLRLFERRRERIAAGLTEDEETAEVPAEAVDPQSGTGMEFRQVSSMPSHLPSAGAGVGALGLTMLMGYCGVLHQRARKRC
ncbi:MAG: hypothetical protein WCX61_00280 [Candidatus Peribacteraceae bacterium]|jgi:hypothetical protein